MNTDFMKSGIVVPILTPVDKDEKIDEAKLREQVDFVIDGGVVGVLAFGSNGEFYMVEEDEMERALKIMVDQAKGRVPVFMGIGGIATKKCIRIAKMPSAFCSRCLSNRPKKSCTSTSKQLLMQYRICRCFSTIIREEPGIR